MSKQYEKGAPNYIMTTVMEEAASSLLCYDAPSFKSCPAGTDPARFIRSVRFRNLKGAAETIRENNAMGAICARVCPTEKYCELACSRTEIDCPIDIGGIQRFVTDYEEQKKNGHSSQRRFKWIEHCYRRQWPCWVTNGGNATSKRLCSRHLRKE